MQIVKHLNPCWCHRPTEISQETYRKYYRYDRSLVELFVFLTGTIETVFPCSLQQSLFEMKLIMVKIHRLGPVSWMTMRRRVVLRPLLVSSSVLSFYPFGVPDRLLVALQPNYRELDLPLLSHHNVRVDPCNEIVGRKTVAISRGLAGLSRQFPSWPLFSWIRIVESFDFCRLSMILVF
jgi:hypothetical protein